MNLPPITTIASLQEHLQSAVALEFSTIPVYLAGQWTIKNPGDPCATLIGNVAVAEMGHMAIAANCLTATGGTPSITSAVPVYPAYLPDGEDEFEVSILPFGPGFLTQAMAIEEPDAPPTAAMTALVASRKAIPRRHRLQAMGNTYPTIGDFYRNIIDGIGSLCASLGEAAVFPNGGNPALQVATFNGGSIAVTGQSTATTLLTHIIEEGEGATGTIWDENGNLAHFYTFQEISLGKTYVQGDSPGSPSGAAIVMPTGDQVYPMLPNPSLTDFLPATSQVYQDALAFDAVFTSLVNALQTTFTGNPGALSGAVGTMFQLQPAATTQLGDPAPGNPGLVAGPTFEMIPASPAAVTTPNPTTTAAAPTWYVPIAGYFTPGDVACMKNMGIDLSSYASVVANGSAIYGQLSGGNMPPGNPWPATQVATFQAWMNAGYPEGTPPAQA